MTDPTRPERTRPTRTGRTRPHRAERREEILRAATGVFGSKGYHAGSLVEVAEQVGITHAGVLHHFGSKDTLLREVLEYRDRIDVEHLEGQHIPGGLDLFRHLMTTARMNTERRGIVQAYAVLTGESVTDGHPAADWVTERFAVLRDEISTAVQQVADERGVELDETMAARAASAVIGVMDGLQLQWLLEPDAVGLADDTAFAIEAILAAALAGPAAPRLVD